MSLGNTGGNTGILYILKVVDKDKEKKKVEPHFTVTKKVDGKWTLQPETVTRVSGTLSKIVTEEKEWEGTKYNVVSLWLKDGEEAYLIDLRFNLPSRSLFNSLASLEQYTDLSVTVYANKSGYTALGLWQGDKMVKWKYKLDELPEPDKVMFKGKEMSDYTKVDDFFLAVLKEIGGKLGGSKPAASKPKTETPAGNAPQNDEDVPF